MDIMTSPYITNFVREINTGNVLPYGRDLIVTVKGATIVTGKLSKKQGFGWKLIQIDQSGNKANPALDTITFEMKERKIINGIGTTVPLPRGKYQLHVGAHGHPGCTSDFNFFKDVFEVV